MKNILILISFFSFLYYYPIYCGLCGINPPEDKSYCGNYLALNLTHRCAYCKEKATGKYYCLVQIRKKEIPGFECQNSDYVLLNEDLPGAPCLNHREIKEMDPKNISKEFCQKYSTDAKHPCCYYDDGVNKKCFSIGKITSTTLYTYNDFLDCGMKFIELNIVLYFTVLFFLFFE